MNVALGFDPVIARIGALELGWHGLFTALAVVVAVWLGVRAASRMGYDEESLTGVAVWGVVGGVVGARLFHVADHLPTYLADPLAILRVWEGGIAVYGAFIGGIAAGIVGAKRAGLPVWPLLDAAAPAMLVGQAIGRLGCLANGDAWGAPCLSCGAGGCPLCLVYTHPNALLPSSLLGVPTQPYPLYELLLEVAVLAGLWLARKRLAATRPGVTFLLAALGYALIRFSLSYLRQETVLVWGLQEAQVIALATGAVVMVLLAVRLRPRVLQLAS